MIQLSIINPHTIFTLFARLKFFYAKSPFIGDFPPFLAPCHNNTNTAISNLSNLEITLLQYHTILNTIKYERFEKFS